MLVLLGEIGGVFFLVLGTAFCALGIYGLLRLGDLYNRLHAAGMVVTLGAMGIMVALLLLGPPRAGVKGIATAIFLFLSGPLVTHVLARTAHSQGIRMENASARDDLAGDQHNQDRSEPATV